MKLKNNIESAAQLLTLSIDELFKEAYKAVEVKNSTKLHDIDLLTKRYYCTQVAHYQFENLINYNTLLVNFIIWFEWGGKPKWKAAVPIVNQWKTILELSQLISQTESPQKAYREIKNTEYGEMIVTLLHDEKFMKPSDIKRKIKKKSIQSVSSIISKFEKCGIVNREVEGKNVSISLDRLGIEVYRDYIKPHTANISRLIFSALKEIDKDEFGKAKEKLLTVIEIEPDNPYAVFLLGIILLEKGDLQEAGEFFAEAAKLGIDKEQSFLVFYLLEQKQRLKPLEAGIVELNTQADSIAEKVRPSLYFLGMLNEFLGKTSRANEYYRLCNTGR